MTLRTAARGRPILQWKMRLLSSLPLYRLMEQLWDNLTHAMCDGESSLSISCMCCVGLESSNSPFGVVTEQPHLAMNVVSLLSWRTPELGPFTHQGLGTPPPPFPPSPPQPPVTIIFYFWDQIFRSHRPNKHSVFVFLFLASCT